MSDDAEPVTGGIAADRLRSIVDRVERLETERKDISESIRDIFVEAKSTGYEPKVLKQVIRLRKLDPSEVEEASTLLDLYMRALGG
jgi:uncharacterized protein (UPF0335 family)